MSDDLSALVRAAALDEEAAAGRDHPYSAAVLGRYVRDVRRRRVAGGAMLAVAGAVVIGGAVFGADRMIQAGPGPDVPIGDPTTSTTPSPAPTWTPSPTPTPTPTVTPTPTPTQPAPTETAEPPAPEETTAPPAPPPVEPPGVVTIVGAGPGGGSGEVTVRWGPTPGATGYSVYRSDSPDGPFVRSARYDVASGVTTVEYSGGYEYIGIWAMTPGGDSDYIEYVEVVTGARAYFKVAAFNAAGEGPASGAVCGSALYMPTDC